MDNYELFITTKAASFSLHNLNKDSIPLDSASGSLVRYRGNKLFLTVSHATLKSGKWCFKVDTDKENNKVKYYCPIFRFLTKFQIRSDIEDKEYYKTLKEIIEFVNNVDFSYAFVPEDLVAKEEFIDNTHKKKIECEKVIYDLENIGIPNTNENYSFYGETKTKINLHEKIYSFTPKMVVDLKFLKKFDDFYVFKLNHIIKDEQEAKDYKGCSGAPILNSEGNIVSLITHCKPNTPWIFGINLEKYKLAIDIDILSGDTK